MSNSLAIAAVTTTLQRLLIQGVSNLPGVSVTVKPPDKAFGGGAVAIDQINIFLYQTTPNAAWRNRDIPNQVRPGETSQQPLALSLHYLITASGAGDDDIKSHQWLGKAMSLLHDHSILGRQEINDTIAALGDSKLQEQVERVRITPLSLSIEDLSKLWTTFTTPYRLSAAYEVSVVLIESTRPARSPLPVLDRTIAVQPNFLPPFPTLTQIDIPNAQDVARSGDGSAGSGDVITLQGYQLQPEPGETPQISLFHPRRLEPLHPSIIDSSSATQIIFRLPDNPDPNPMADDPLTDPNQWLVGVYRISVAISRIRQLPDGSSNRETRITNELSLAIAPRITSPPIYTAATRNLSLTCSTRILLSQRAVLLLGDHQVISTRDVVTNAPNAPIATNILDFILPPTILAGDYFVRLRVDGIDSLLVIRQGTPAKLTFDPAQKVTVS